MKNFFVTYGNSSYEKSKQRIIEEASSLGVFDCLKAYSPKDLTQKTTSNPLFRYSKGGGYWIWKPDIILQTLESVNYGDIVVYCDSGCTLNKSSEWYLLFSLLERYDLIGFRINNKIKHYTKKILLEKYKKYNGVLWGNYYQVAATVILLKKTDNTISLIKEWMDNCTMENVFDVTECEVKNQQSGFIAHRHDQSVYSALLYKHYNEGWIKIVWENFDKKTPSQAIWASRISDESKRGAGNIGGVKYLIKRYVILPIRSSKQFFWEIINQTIV